MLHIECVAGYCPSGDACTNQRMQRAVYCDAEVFKTEHKGFGLRALEPIEAGRFVIEYVGELISAEECQRRLARAKADDKNFYFLTLSSSLAIDAGRRGNKARFLNHSCDPNCETQKWNVLGETRVGLFAKRDIAVGDELTFDYQYERVGSGKQL